MFSLCIEKYESGPSLVSQLNQSGYELIRVDTGSSSSLCNQTFLSHLFYCYYFSSLIIICIRV
jgi:hypothetical protein